MIFRFCSGSVTPRRSRRNVRLGRRRPLQAEVPVSRADDRAGPPWPPVTSTPLLTNTQEERDRWRANESRGDRRIDPAGRARTRPGPCPPWCGPRATDRASSEFRIVQAPGRIRRCGGTKFARSRCEPWGVCATSGMEPHAVPPPASSADGGEGTRSDRATMATSRGEARRHRRRGSSRPSARTPSRGTGCSPGDFDVGWPYSRLSPGRPCRRVGGPAAASRSKCRAPARRPPRRRVAPRRLSVVHARPPLRIRPVGLTPPFSPPTCRRAGSGDNTWHSRNRRAITCVYCDPKSRMTIFSVTCCPCRRSGRSGTVCLRS